METRELLRRTIADFFEVDVNQVGPTFPLTGPIVHGSIGRATLASRIQHHVGLKSKAIYSAVTYGELEAELIPGAANSVPAPVGSSSPSNNGSGPVNARRMRRALPAVGGQVSCGIDMELVENLPTATDYWEDAFYRASFTPVEIAYCLMQEKPSLHFAARWCAKEALKKCDPAFFSEELKDLEVVSGESREPLLNHHVGGEVRTLPHAVSISHTPLAAIAVVIKVGNESAQRVVSPTPAALTSGPRPEPAESPPRASSNRFSVLQTLVALAALGLAILALYRTFHFG